MKHNQFTFSISRCMALVGMLTLAAACNDEVAPDFGGDDTEITTVDALQDYYFDEGDDLITEAFTQVEGGSGGKTQTDDRLICAEVTRTGSDTGGEVRIDFGNGCTDGRGNTRRGAIVITYSGRWNVAGSSWSVSLDNYFINNIQVEGTRTVTVDESSASRLVVEVVMSGGKLTWPDGRTAIRDVTRRREHERDSNGLLNRLIIYGSAQGTQRNGRGYQIEILEPLVYTRTCAAAGAFIPVSGVKKVTYGLRELTIDYGDGACDNLVLLTNQAGRSVTFEVKKS